MVGMRAQLSRLAGERGEVEALVVELSELTGYDLSTTRSIALLLGLERLARLARREVRKGHPPVPFLGDAEYWRLYKAAGRSIDELRQALISWRGRGVEAHA
jgi:hypothetical protein